MWLERFIISKAEKRLASYRDDAKKFKQQHAATYQTHLPQIEMFYARATHWHGTGRYHYHHTAESRYGAVNTDTLTDVLASILKRNGLLPHHDPWINSGGKTVSLATVRMHARAFARMHTAAEKPLQYELGSLKFWLRFYFCLLFIWLITHLWSLRSFIYDTCRPTFKKDIQNWASALRKPKDGKVVSVFDIFRGNIPTSDIAHNYPVLIGVACEVGTLIDTVPLTHKVEQRSLSPITLAQFTHLEVPLRNIAETEALLVQSGLSIPVLPLEYGDAYLADEPLKSLAFTA